jgi:uncharacterized protein
MTLSRRDLIRTTSLAGVGLTLTGNAKAVFAAEPAIADAAASADFTGYGALVSDPAGLLDVPAGFTYRVVTKTGWKLKDVENDPLVKGNVPGAMDGATSFPGTDGTTLLVTNHELDIDDSEYLVVGDPDLTYDPAAGGGTTTTVVDEKNHRVSQRISLAGTVRNCAGGRTPWGTWLSCEETEVKAGERGATKDHGYVFEVDPYHQDSNRIPVPLKALGRFSHEAVAVDSMTGQLYLTEDNSAPNGLLYRFTPNTLPNRLHSLRDGGLLEAMHAPEVPDLSVITKIGSTFSIRWKAVPDSQARNVPTRQQFTFEHNGIARPGTGGDITRSRKLEGAYWSGDHGYFVCSFARYDDGSSAEHDGQVWRLDPRAQTIELVLRFAVNRAPNRPGRYDGPDNITISPYGGVILAEDGEGLQHLIGATDTGGTYPIARNRINIGTATAPAYGELSGPTFSPDGRTLFFNVYDPGVCFAVTGPWLRFGPAVR